MRSPVVALVAFAAAAVAGVAAVGAGDERDLAFTTNVRAVRTVIDVAPGAQACQNGLESAAEFDAVELLPGTGEMPGPPLLVTAREEFTHRELATGRLPAGARDNQGVRVRLERPVPERERFDLCVRNDGERSVAFYGGPDRESPGHSVVGEPGAELHPGKGDMRIVFLRSEPRSALAQLPDMFDRATRFRPDAVGEWTFWLLLVAVAAGIPALLAVAVRSTRRT